MNTATFRFYAELNDFLPPTWKYACFNVLFPAGQTVKHLIESCGVPHTEVDLILVNGVPVNFSYQLNDGDRVSIYPIFETNRYLDSNDHSPKPTSKDTVCVGLPSGQIGSLSAIARFLTCSTGMIFLMRNWQRFPKRKNGFA